MVARPSWNRALPLAAAAAAAILLAGCPLPYDFSGRGAGSSDTVDPSSPRMTAPVTVSYAVQGGATGYLADGGSQTFGDTTTVTLATATDNAFIYYTDDGTTIADVNKAKRIAASSGSITVTRADSLQSVALHAVAIGPNMVPSPQVGATVIVSPYPILTVTCTAASIAEGGGTSTFTILASTAPAADITVNLQAGGDWEAGDFTGSLPASTVLSAGSTTRSFPITGVGDADGDNETVVLTILPDSAPAQTYSVGVPASAAVTIQDDRTPVLTITGSASTVTDTGGVIVYTVSSSFAPASDLAVYLQAGGTYEPGDVTGIGSPGSSFPLTLPAGSVSVTRTVTAQPDIGEWDSEAVTLSLAAGGGYTIGSPSSATATVLDSSPIPTLTLTSDRESMLDGQAATFTVTASVAPEDNHVVGITSSGYTAGKVFVPPSVTIPAGATSATFQVSTPSEVGYPVQTPQVSLAAGPGHALGTPSSRGLLITDDLYAWLGSWDFGSGLASSVPGAQPWSITGGISLVGGSLSFPGGSDIASNNISGIINQDLFTIGVGFRLTDFGTGWGRAIVAAGLGYRWVILRSDVSGNLYVDLNNHANSFSLGFSITAGTDHSLLVSIDRAALTLTAEVDGVRHVFSLPAGFTWNTTSPSEMVLYNRDYSTGSNFAGLWHWVYVAAGALP